MIGIHSLALVLAMALPGEWIGSGEPDPLRPWLPPFQLSEAMVKVLKEINSVGPYQVPNLPRKQVEVYAYTPIDVTPFRHVEPHKRHFLEQMEYWGAGRAIPEPEDVKTVKIGFIGPLVPTVSVAVGGRSHNEERMGIKMLQGARLAIEEANQRGGYIRRGIPFELVVRNDNGLWGSSGNEVIDLAYKEGVWAILGSIDGANTHIMIRVGLKIELVMMTSGDLDPTYIETNIPWAFRCIGDDRQMGYLLVDYMYRKLGLKRVAILRSSNRYGRFGIREIVDGSRRLGRPIVAEMAYPVGCTDFSLQLERIRAARADAVVHWGNAEDGARALNQMREMGMDVPFFACDRCISEEFVKIAGPNAEGVICTSPWNPKRDDPIWLAFKERFRARYNEDPETYAAHAYDGMNMLIWAIQVAGLNRAKIRDVLAYRPEPFVGVTGEIPLSAVNDDDGEVYLAKFVGGEWHYYSRQELGLPPREALVQPRPDQTARK
jgi:ABC-type branched-subunit amino acid transport system substrate-binding protein